MRNHLTDGSIYLVRPARIQCARTDLTVTIGALIAFAFVIGIMSAVQRSTDGMLAVFLRGAQPPRSACMGSARSCVRCSGSPRGPISAGSNRRAAGARSARQRPR
ncbi:hypothetical protein [Burkholderia multivorans]|uniref:hypothetical protein n=1 Tax=Burkholderia multivorans TaxID=87883 RepID=UPI002158F955|nr:hypothetical protein [Burkholderia multivorans]